MKNGLQVILLAFWCLTVPVKADAQIFWSSTQDATNLAADGTSAMDGSFRFELGVFSGSFVPTSANVTEWSGNWNAAKRTLYQLDRKRFSDSFNADTINTTFTAGKAVYVWGFKGDPAAGEWILFRASSWVWPSSVAGPPSFVEWFARDATAVLGNINSTGTPFLMQAAAVTNAVPPVTTYAQWQTDELSGETLIQPHQDADGDGTANILEFVFGTSPIATNPSPMATAMLASQSLQLTVPRRADRPATLVVEVSENLSVWNSGPAHTITVFSSTTSLTVRDLIPISPTAPKRFIRLKATP